MRYYNRAGAEVNPIESLEKAILKLEKYDPARTKTEIANLFPVAQPKLDFGVIAEDVLTLFAPGIACSRMCMPLVSRPHKGDQHIDIQQEGRHSGSASSSRTLFAVIRGDSADRFENLQAIDRTCGTRQRKPATHKFGYCFFPAPATGCLRNVLRSGRRRHPKKRVVRIYCNTTHYTHHV